MTTKVKKSIMGVMCIMGVVFCVHTAKKDSDARFDTWLQLANAEALASGEAGSIYCIGSGSVDCHGYKVERKIVMFSPPLYK